MVHLLLIKQTIYTIINVRGTSKPTNGYTIIDVQTRGAERPRFRVCKWFSVLLLLGMLLFQQVSHDDPCCCASFWATGQNMGPVHSAARSRCPAVSFHLFATASSKLNLSVHLVATLQL